MPFLRTWPSEFRDGRLGPSQIANLLCSGLEIHRIANRKFTSDASNRIFFSYERTAAMNWYNYVACFFAGAFLANFVPHFVHGISGDRFPTPFAHPPGRGLSSPTLNVAWAFLNLLVGGALY